MIKIILSAVAVISTSLVQAADYKWHGVVDVRATSADTITSYVDTGYGKFGNNNGTSVALAQFGSEFIAEWENGIATHIVTNAYADENDTNFGITEAFVKYRGLPNSYGYRWQSKLGIFYPEISIENNAFAWASRNTLNSSAINTWIGEEIRVLGSEVSLTRLGKFHKDNFDISASITAFINNDPAGSLLSWYGWTLGNRQTLWTAKKSIPALPARDQGYFLEGQAAASDPFIELDDKVGYHLNTKVKIHNKGQFSLGYYDNNGTPYIVKNGQYSWRTRFLHASIRWRLPLNIEFSAQYLNGDTLMQSPSRFDVVNNDYSSGYIALSKRSAKHRYTMRLEEFSITDNDQTFGDSNQEYGKAMTLNYSYRYSKPWFLSLEYNWINSDRAARMYSQNSSQLIERQLQLAARYFF